MISPSAVNSLDDELEIVITVDSLCCINANVIGLSSKCWFPEIENAEELSLNVRTEISYKLRF